VRLPKGVFAPYTSINTNLLFFTKGTPTKEIWFYEHPYPDGVKSYNKTKPMKIEEFEVEKGWWGNEDNVFDGREEGEYAWKVSLQDIKVRNYNLDIKNPHMVDREVHDPELLLSQYSEMQKKISALRNDLKTILSAAFDASK
jgi:type I restriction enzyme M protein